MSVAALFLAAAAVMATIALRERWVGLGFTSIALALGVLAVREGRRRKRRLLRVGGWLVAWIALAVGSPAVVLNIYMGVGRISPPRWPGALVRMAAAFHAESGNVDAEFLGGIIDQEYVWTIPLENGAPDVALPADMGPIDARDVPSWFPERFPIWWRPDPNGDVTFFSTPDFPFDRHGGHGEHLVVMFDRSARRLYVWLRQVGW